MPPVIFYRRHFCCQIHVSLPNFVKDIIPACEIYMKKVTWSILIFSLILISCGPNPTPELPTPIPPTRIPTLVPLDLSMPMQVGSSFNYVDGSTLVAVPAGSFIMGVDSDRSTHTVELRDYWIYATEVTNQQYSICVARGQCSPPDQIDDLGYTDFASQSDPVVGVTYEQAQAYCGFVNASLPTEAQWEKAARGTDGNKYPWGNDDPACDLLNFNNCTGNSTDVTKYPKGASYYGALDMEGNVYEWVADWYDALYYKDSKSQDPTGPDSGKARVIRSSSYKSNSAQIPVYIRSFASPGEHRRDLGFRCVVNDPTYFAPSCQLVSVADASQLSSVTTDCPAISIDSVAQSCSLGGGSIVTFKDDHPNDPNASIGGVSGCKVVSGIPGSFPLQFKCMNSSTAIMTTNCTYSGITNTSCPKNYQLDPTTGLCNWTGKSTSALQCLAGTYYDPVHNCCVNPTGVGANYPACPVGTVFIEDTSGHYVCLPGGNALNVQTQTKSVSPLVCPNVCSLNADTCSQLGQVFCSTLCQCFSVGFKCPKPTKP